MATYSSGPGKYIQLLAQILCKPPLLGGIWAGLDHTELCVFLGASGQASKWLSSTLWPFPKAKHVSPLSEGGDQRPRAGLLPLPCLGPFTGGIPLSLTRHRGNPVTMKTRQRTALPERQKQGQTSVKAPPFTQTECLNPAKAHHGPLGHPSCRPQWPLIAFHPGYVKHHPGQPQSPDSRALHWVLDSVSRHGPHHMDFFWVGVLLLGLCCGVQVLS